MIVKPIFEVFHFTKPTPAYLQAMRAEQSKETVTYTEIGRTLGELPAGYHHLHTERVVGTGEALMLRGQEAIRMWAAQSELGLILEPPVPEFAEGSILAFAIPLKPSPMWATGSCRIVRIVDEPHWFGFVYGTLPHHPECGEEAFLVHHRDDDQVVLSVSAFSRATSLPMRVAGPIGRIIQRRAAETYLDGYERYVHRR
jgi:uncharacterized protein (UPF0548 family)